MRETRQWIALDKHHQAAGPELGDLSMHIHASACRALDADSLRVEPPPAAGSLALTTCPRNT